MWSSARGKATYICLLAKARTLLIQRMCVWRVRYVSKSGLCETEAKWRETIAWNCFKWLSKLKCFNGIPQNCKKCHQDIPRPQERSAFSKTIFTQVDIDLSKSWNFMIWFRFKWNSPWRFPANSCRLLFEAFVDETIPFIQDQPQDDLWWWQLSWTQEIPGRYI